MFNRRRRALIGQDEEEGFDWSTGGGGGLRLVRRKRRAAIGQEEEEGFDWSTGGGGGL